MIQQEYVRLIPESSLLGLLDFLFSSRRLEKDKDVKIMSRSIRVGDLAIVKVGIQKYPLRIFRINSGKISAGDYQIIRKNNLWQVENYQVAHDVLFQQGPGLRIASLNLGYYIMENIVAGTEAKMVEKCQKTYAGGWLDPSHTISTCSYNGAKLLSNYNLFGVQEMDSNYRQNFQELLPHHQFIHGRGVSIGYIPSITGKGMPLTSPNYLLVSRGMQVVWFPRMKLIFVNLHAPHDIDLKKTIEKQLAEFHVKPEKVIIVGDFNDYRGILLTQSIDAFGLQMKVPLEKKVLTCCTDSKYKYPGDYILTSRYDSEYYGYPKEHDRSTMLISDHEPVVLIPDDQETYYGVTSWG